MALAPGTKLGVYEIQSLLGAGGMGEVYRATDTKHARDVALKLLAHGALDKVSPGHLLSLLPMFHFLRFRLGSLSRCFHSRHSLLLENLALRQQLAVLKRRHPRPKLSPLDKLFWVLARR
jgi:serine/threonine protein kinase